MQAWILPFDAKTITGHFGLIRTFKGAPTNPHRGTDFAPGVNKPIPALADGKIALIKWSNILGWVLVLKVPDGKQSWFVGYCHLSCAIHGPDCEGPEVLGAHSPVKSVKQGMSVKQGRVIGRVGNSGSASFGAHLHITLSRTLTGVFAGVVVDLVKHVAKTIKLAAKAGLKKEGPDA